MKNGENKKCAHLGSAYKALKYKICISGAAVTNVCSENALKLAEETGREIVRQSGVLLTGATTGIPYWAAKGAKEEGGISIGFSPAASEAAHVKTYHLPTDYFDLIVYTGFDYSGRNLLLTRASDGVVIICGRLGTLNEFTIAYEDKKPVGVLEGSGGTADTLREIVERSKRGPGSVVYDTDPKRLIQKLIKMINREKNVKMDHTFDHGKE